MKTTVATETSFSIQPDENTMKHIVALKSLNEKLSEALKSFHLADAYIKSEMKRDDGDPLAMCFLYGDISKKIFDIENNINDSILSASEAIGMLCASCLAEQAMDTTERA